jgi:hypothetical protein
VGKMDSGTAVGPTGSPPTLSGTRRLARERLAMSCGVVIGVARWVGGGRGGRTISSRKATMQALRALEPFPPYKFRGALWRWAARVFESLVASKQCRDWGPRLEMDLCDGICSRNSWGRSFVFIGSVATCLRQRREVDARRNRRTSDEIISTATECNSGAKSSRQALTDPQPRCTGPSPSQSSHVHRPPTDHRPPTTTPTGAHCGGIWPASKQSVSRSTASVSFISRSGIS